MTLRVHPDDIVANSSNPLLAKHPSWQRVRVQEIANIRNGFAFKSAQFNSTGEGVPLIRIRDVGRDETDTFFSGDFNDEYWVEPGDLIIGMDGDFRVARWRGPRALLNQRVCRLRVFRPETYDQGFLLHVLPAYLDAIWQHTSSVTVKHLSSRTVADIPVPLPSREEQRRIVAAIEEQFSRLDAAEECIRRSKTNLGSFRAAALADSFAGDYKSRLLGEVARTQLGKMLSKKAHRGGPGGRPYLRNKNVQWGRVDLNDVATMEFSEAEAEKFRLQEGDVLVCEGGEVGRAAIWRSELGDCYFQKALHRVRPSAELSPDFLVYYLRRLADTNGFDPYVTGSTIDHLPQEDLRVIPVPVPSREQQGHVVALVEQRLSVAEAIEAELDVSLQRSAGLRQAILKEAFGGRLVPQNPSTNPGSDFHQKVEA